MKKLKVDMNLVFFGIVAAAFLFTVWTSINPNYQYVLDQKSDNVTPQDGALVFSGTISEADDSPCSSQQPRVFIVGARDLEVLSEGSVQVENDSWQYRV